MRTSDPAINEVASMLRASSEAQLSPPRIDDQPALNAFIRQVRREFDKQFGAIPPAADVAIAELAGLPLTGEVYTPPSSLPGRVLLYFHGGGQVFGSPLSHRHLVSRLAAAAGITAWSLEYPLAPELPFPHALNSSVDFYMRMLSDRQLDPKNIVFAGDSGGGNLAMALVLSLKAKAMPLPAGLFLISPLLDLTLENPSHQLLQHKEKWANPAITRLCIDLMAAGEPLTNPLLSPNKGDLSGLPRLLIQVGTDEIFLGDSLELASKAAMAGSDVTLRVYQDMFHAWHLFHSQLCQDGIGAISEAANWIRSTVAD